jgi:hypothetical protein
VAGFDLLKSAKAFKQYGLEGRELSETFQVSTNIVIHFLAITSGFHVIIKEGTNLRY